ncbi:MAG: DUF3558 domain-containing protein, partial [Rhodococcus sp.]|nr:DUF3558 domain-containing protein [Rhodococcus sp. (in: high G+C Gram-positive bacteria)]
MRRIARAAVAAVTALIVAGCTSTVEGTPQPEGSGGVAAGELGDFTRLLEECNALTDEKIAEVIGADAIVRGFFGAICRWDAVGAMGTTSVTFNWFETGSLETERSVADGLGYEVSNISIEGRRALAVRQPADPGSCNVTAGSPSGGVFGWWVQYGAGGGDPC